MESPAKVVMDIRFLISSDRIHGIFVTICRMITIDSKMCTFLLHKTAELAFRISSALCAAKLY